jgi:hypothetical protein
MAVFISLVGGMSALLELATPVCMRLAWIRHGSIDLRPTISAITRMVSTILYSGEFSFRNACLLL